MKKHIIASAIVGYIIAMLVFAFINPSVSICMISIPLFLISIGAAVIVLATLYQAIVDSFN